MFFAVILKSDCLFGVKIRLSNFGQPPAIRGPTPVKSSISLAPTAAACANGLNWYGSRPLLFRLMGGDSVGYKSSTANDFSVAKVSTLLVLLELLVVLVCFCFFVWVFTHVSVGGRVFLIRKKSKFIDISNRKMMLLPKFFLRGL